MKAEAVSKKTVPSQGFTPIICVQLGSKTLCFVPHNSPNGTIRATESTRLWRKRVGVEPTTRLARSRIAGFEDREDHRTLFASTKSIEAASGASTATIFAPQICNADLSFLLILSVPQFSRQRFTNMSLRQSL